MAMVYLPIWAFQLLDDAVKILKQDVPNMIFERKKIMPVMTLENLHQPFGHRMKKA